jgi:hypothetical protein
MNLLSFATMGMVPVTSSGGGGKGNGDDDAKISILVDAQTREPKAEPDSARVGAGGKITWKCAEPFKIVLKLLWTEQRVERESKKTGDMHVLEVTAGAVYGTYSYGIAVKGGDVDPDVIIGPRSQHQ